MIKCEKWGYENILFWIQRRDVIGNLMCLKHHDAKKWYLLTYIDFSLTSLLFFDHSTRGQRRWDVIFLTFSLKSRKTISFKHSSTFSTSINYGLCAFFDILNTMASQIHGRIIDSIALQPYKANYIMSNLKDISQKVHEKYHPSIHMYIYRHYMIT